MVRVNPPTTSETLLACKTFRKLLLRVVDQVEKYFEPRERCEQSYFEVEIGEGTSKDVGWDSPVAGLGKDINKWKLSASSPRALCCIWESVRPCQGRRKILGKDARAKKWRLSASSESLFSLVKVGERDSQPIKLPSHCLALKILSTVSILR